ncbi:MAG TPA: DUF411 domain-containing protein [Longimicrobiales bacterium]|nr:DUF411 domain-containing protein [Longimicrobiales bacterium]
MNRRESVRLLTAGIVGMLVDARHLLAATTSKNMTVYKSPTCGCCNAWVKHVRAGGYDVKAINVDDVTPFKEKYGVPLDLASCHTGFIDGYAIEGHVPVDLIDKLLREQPKGAKALIVPGMPIGSPGMEVPGRKDAYNVILVDNKGARSVFARR